MAIAQRSMLAYVCDMSPGNQIGLRQTQTQRLLLNKALVASLGVLRSDAAGLTRFLEQQAALNPHLRLEAATPPAAGEWLPRWTFAFGRGGGDAALEFAQSAGPSLMAHVTAKIDDWAPIGKERQIAMILAEALEPSGWIGRPLAEIAAELGCTVPQIEAVLMRMQAFEPAGLFARNLAECLRLQLVETGLMDAVFDTMLQNLDLLASGDLNRLARLAGVNGTDLTRRFRIIRSLNPKPGTQFSVLAADPVREPDLLVERTSAAEWAVSLNRSVLPSVLVRKSDQGSAAALTAAKALERMVAARNSTLLRVGREVLQRQQAALDGGPAMMVPLTMAEVAAALGLAESTISRVVAGASVDTPQGTWWLRRLFSGRVPARDGANAEISTTALKDRLGRLIASEVPDQPLTDHEIARILTQGGTPVARRTVAKYRAVMGISAAHRRSRAKPAPRKS